MKSGSARDLEMCVSVCMTFLISSSWVSLFLNSEVVRTQQTNREVNNAARKGGVPSDKYFLILTDASLDNSPQTYIY